MDNGGIRGSSGMNPPNVSTDNVDSTEAGGVSENKTPPNAEKSSESADNSVAFKQGAKEKGSMRGLAERLMNADLQKLFDHKSAVPLNTDIAEKLKIGKGQIADPKNAANLVKDAANDPKLFEKIIKEGTKESKQLFANAILSDPNLSNAKKTEMLRQLTAPPKGKEAALTINDIVQNATTEGIRNLGKIITDTGLIIESGKLMEGINPAAVSKALTAFHFDRSLTDAQKNSMSRGLLFLANEKDLDTIFSQNKSNLSFQDAIASSDPGLLVKLAQNISPQNMNQLAEMMTRTNPPRTEWLSLMARSLKDPDKMNAMIDGLQTAGKLDDFLTFTSPSAFFSQLTPQNAGAVSAEYSRMAQLEKDPVRAKRFREYAAQADGMAENQFKKNDYDEYVRVRDHYHK